MEGGGIKRAWLYSVCSLARQGARREARRGMGRRAARACAFCVSSPGNSSSTECWRGAAGHGADGGGGREGVCGWRVTLVEVWRAAVVPSSMTPPPPCPSF